MTTYPAKRSMGSASVTPVHNFDIHIESGRFFRFGYCKDSVADSGSIYLCVTTPSTNTTRTRFWCQVGSGGSASGKLELFEAPTLSAEGTAVSPVYQNRNAPYTALSSAKHTPTVTSTGTPMGKYFFGAATVPLGGGAGGQENSLNFLLKPNTQYLFKVTNNSGDAASYFVCANMIEESTDPNDW